MRTKTFQLQDVDGGMHDYEVSPFGGRQGLALGRAIIPLFDGVATVTGGDTNIDVTRALKAVSGILDESMIATVLGQTKRDGRLLTLAVIDEVYMANYSELLQVIYEVLKFNFGSIITDSGKLMQLVDL